MRARIIPRLLLLLPFSVAGVAHAARVASTQELKVGPHATISVESDGGAVTVEPGAAGRVTVETINKSDSEDAAKAVTVTLEGNTVRVRYHRDRARKLWHSDSIDFHITAPGDSKVVSATGGGSVSVRGMTGGVDVETGGGSVDVHDAQGTIHVRTGGGGIEIANVGGNVEASTGGGSVRLRGALRGTNRVETGGGSIHVAIPADSKLDVDASTGGGSAHNDFGLAVDGGHWGPPRGFHGKIGDGSGGSLQMHTGGGSISLERS